MTNWQFGMFIAAILLSGSLILSGAYPGIMSTPYFPNQRKNRLRIVLGSTMLTATYILVYYYFFVAYPTN